MICATQPAAEKEQPITLRRLVRRDGPQVLGAAAATMAVELGVWAIATAAGAGPLEATLATLATCAVWTALAAGVLAASADDALGALLRGGIAADASAVTLLALWLAGPYVSLLAALKIYCILVCMAMAAVAAAHLPRTPVVRYAAAVLVAVILMLLLTTPLWTGGILAALDGEARHAAVRWAVEVNPFYGITAAVVDRTHWVWHQSPLMYRLTRIGDYAAPPPAAWYASAWRLALVALLLAGIKSLQRKRRGNPA